MKKLVLFLEKHPIKILAWAIVTYFVLFSAICIWKYFQFGYNGLDLAIINQVFYNSSQGNLFYFTIHPNSYLGDHFALIMLLLLPFYFLFQHPVSLLIFQSLILALSAWPIYLIARKVLKNPWPLAVALLWLFNPFVQNINLFEFHFLPFAIFFLLFAFHFYQKKHFGYFLLFMLLSLLVREDVALVTFFFGLLAWIEKRDQKWIFWPLIISAGWFLMAVQIISRFAPQGSYKFLYYYSWLGSSFGAMVTNFFIHPLNTLKHIFSANNLLFTAVLLLPFGYLTLLRPKYLLLGLFIFLEIVLGGSTNSIIVLKLHYTALFLPVLFIALIYALELLKQTNAKNRALRWLQDNRTLPYLILIIGTAYGFLTVGPITGTMKKMVRPTYTTEVRQLKQEFFQSVPPKNSTVGTYEYLTYLSSRPRVYGLNYAFVGKKQFSDLDYELPGDVETMLLDFDDFLTFGVQFPNSKQWREYYRYGDDNLRKLIEERDFKVSKITDTLVMMERFNDLGVDLYQTAERFYDIKNVQDTFFDNGLRFIGWTPLSVDYYPLMVNEEIPEDQGQITDFVSKRSADHLLPVALYFQAREKIEDNYQLILKVKNKNGRIVHQKMYPLAYGLYPTSEWQTDEVVKVNYWFLIPEEIKAGDYQIELELAKYKGYLTLDGYRSAVMKITDQESLKPAIELTDYHRD